MAYGYSGYGYGGGYADNPAIYGYAPNDNGYNYGYSGGYGSIDSYGGGTGYGGSTYGYGNTGYGGGNYGYSYGSAYTS